MRMGILYGKYQMDFRKWCFAFVSLFFFLMVVPVDAGTNIPTKKIFIEEAFTLIGIEYGVHFNYDRAVVADVKVDYESGQYEKMEDALQSIFNQTNLQYEIFDERYVAVYRQDREGVESMKKMVSHFQQVINSSEEAYQRTERRVTPPLASLSIKEIYSKRFIFSVSGTVTDQEGEPLIGVNIQVKDSDKGTATDFDGNFILEDIDENAVLVVSYVGYQTQKLKLAGKSTIQIIMLTDSKMLDEVVITGYGVTQRRAITGSIASLKGDEIENMPVQSFDKAIQGRAAGVLVQTSTGVPGGAVRINIRGIGSINAGTEPMFIIDGVQMNSDAPGTYTSTNVMSYINPNDIESIEILKDAAAAAIYGSQAANGVVLITTKKGKAGKSNFSVNYYEGVSAAIRNMKMLNSQDAIAMRQEALLNNNPNLNKDAALAQALVDFGERGDLTEEEISELLTYDWQGETFKNGSVRNIELNTSGGNEMMTYYLSGAYNKHDGNVTGIDFERGAFKVRMNQKVNERLNLDAGVNLSMITQNGNTGSKGNTSGLAAPQYTSTYMPPSIPIYNEDGTYNITHPGLPGSGFNPIQAATVDDNVTNQKSLIGNVSGVFNITNNIYFKSFYGIDYRYARSAYYRDPRTPNGAAWDGYLINVNAENVNFTTNQTLNYDTKVADYHELRFLIGAEYRSDVRQSETARANNFPTYQFRTNQSAAEPYSVSGSWSGNKRAGVFGQVNYDYQNRLFASFVARYDGSSRFGVNNRYGFFPGISAGWDISKENFLANVGLIDQLKFRVGYGIVGNDQINNVSSRGFYQGGTRYNADAALRLQTLANPELGWERNASLNFGLDISVVENRISGSVELYNRISRSLLLNKPLPRTSGFSSVDANLGKVSNKGLEFDLNTVNLEVNGFRWSSNFNISFLKNRVLDLYDGLEYISNTVRVGYPLKIWYRSHFAGVNAANGRSMWYDKEGNITYQPTSEDNQPTDKGWQSDYFGGITNTFSYKGIELSALIHFDMGRYMDNTMYRVWENIMSNPGRNTLQELYDNRWTTPGQVTHVPRPIAGGSEVNSASRSRSSTLHLQDASYIRLREVTLSYMFSSESLKSLKISRARIYLTGVNLLTLTKWIGFDPEFAVYGDVESNQGVVPQTKSLVGGVQIKF